MPEDEPADIIVAGPGVRRRDEPPSYLGIETAKGNALVQRNNRAFPSFWILKSQGSHADDKEVIWLVCSRNGN